MIRPCLLFALTIVIALASGCSRSQAAPLISTPPAPSSTRETGQEFSAGPTTGPENLVPALQPGTTESVPVAQAAASSENLPATTPSLSATHHHQPGPVSDLLYIIQDR